ncbi:MAG: alpha/beta hydrolase [Chloroflexota bacterium]|nr:alpha/beta hydrolase [Chloroflexota bacterium]
MPFVEHGDARVWYSDLGQGPAVLLIHGGIFEPANGEQFWVQPGIAADLVAAGYRVLVPDRRFCGGQTSALFGAYTWDDEAADFAAVLRDAGAERAHIVAGSNGCSAAIRFGLREAARVRSLLLCWPAARDDDDAALFTRTADFVQQVGTQAYLDMLREQGVPPPHEEQPGFLWGFALLHDERLAASFAACQTQDAARIIRETGKAITAGDLMRGVATRDAEALGEQGFPVAVMPAGSDNPVHPHALAATLTARIPGARQVKGFPESPRPGFSAVRAEFCRLLSALLVD